MNFDKLKDLISKAETEYTQYLEKKSYKNSKEARKYLQYIKVEAQTLRTAMTDMFKADHPKKTS